MNDDLYDDLPAKSQVPAMARISSESDEDAGQFVRQAPTTTSPNDQNGENDYSIMEKIARPSSVPGPVPDPIPDHEPHGVAPKKDVETDREMVEFSNPGVVQTGVNESATAAGLGRIGGLRGFGRAALRNPLIMFPKRAARSVTNLGKSLWKLTKRGGSAITRGWGSLKNRFSKWFGAGAPQPGQADAQGNVEEPKVEDGDRQEGEQAAEEQQPPPPSISVDPQTRFGQHMADKAQLRADMKDPSHIAAEGDAVPQGYEDTKFGDANSISYRMKTGQAVSDEERKYLRLMNQKAMAITDQANAASPDNPTAFPFSQRTQEDKSDSGLATAGHVMTAIGGAINDREEVRPTGDAAGIAYDTLNSVANAGKAGMKQLDKLAKKAGVDDEKVLGSAGKAYADVGKAAQFTYGFVGKDAAKLYDHLHPGPDGHPGHAGKDLTKELDPYANIKNFDRFATVETEVPGTGGLKYSKNVNALSLGKFVEHPATIMQAGGTALTEKFGKPFEKMHKTRADLLERQFATTVMRRMLQADRANKDGLLDDEVDEERRGKEAFPNARAGLVQSVAGEAAAATKLGKEAQQAGYASNFGLDMNTTAMLNDKTHQRQYGGTFNTLMQDRNNIRLRSDADSLDEEVKAELIGKDEAEKKQRELAARAIAQFGIRTAYRRKKSAEGSAAEKLATLQSANVDELQEKAAAVESDGGKDSLAAAAELQWKDRTPREDGADKEQWRGLWNERAPQDRDEAIRQAKESPIAESASGLAVEESKTEDDEREELVQGRNVRKREGLGRVAAGVGQGIGKGLSVTGGVIAFDGGENDLKAGNLGEAATKAAMSEVWQNFGTGGLSKVPVVGDYAKTVGLGVYTPLGEGMKKVGGALEEASFGKEKRDRLFNQHHGLESPNATEETRAKRAELRGKERGIASTINQKKADYFAKAQKLKELTAQGLGKGDLDVMTAQQAVDSAREEIFGQHRGLREVEGELGYSRRRQLARTGLVMPGRAEADFNQPQTPLTEQQITDHQAMLTSKGKSPLSAALPKKLMVYKSKAGGSKDSTGDKSSEVSEQSQEPGVEGIGEEDEHQKEERSEGPVSTGIEPHIDMSTFNLNQAQEPTAIAGSGSATNVDVDEKYAHLFKSDKEVERYLFPR